MWARGAHLGPSWTFWGGREGGTPSCSKAGTVMVAWRLGDIAARLGMTVFPPTWQARVGGEQLLGYGQGWAARSRNRQYAA